MAITIEVQPQDFQSVYNEVILVLDSDKKTQDKFQYVIDVNIDGTFSTRLKVQSNPQGYGIINLSRHLESAINSKLPDLTSSELFNFITESYTAYDVTLYEEYVLNFIFTTVTNNGGFCQYNFSTDHNFTIGDSINIIGDTTDVYDGFQTVTNIPNSTSVVTSKAFVSVGGAAIGAAKLSSDVPTMIEDTLAVFDDTKYVLNNVVDWIDVPSWDSTDYLLTTSTQRKFLTNLPESYFSRIDDHISMNIRHRDNDTARYLKVVSNNGTYYFENQHNISSATKEFLSVRVGAADITGATLAAGSPSSALPVFDDNTTSYTVQTVTTDYVTPSSEERTFKIDRSCTEHENVKLIYLNRGGSYSPFNFIGASFKTVSVKKTNYQQNYGTYDSTLNAYGWESNDVGVKRLDTNVTESIKINSGWLSTEEGDLIKDLIISPQVYYMDANGLIRAVEIKTNSVKIKQKKTDKLINYSLTFEYSTNNANQR